MKQIILAAIASVVFLGYSLAQTDETTFKVDVRSAFVWGDDRPTGAKSWSIKDPLTGNEILKLSHDGVEVSSRTGFEKIHPEEAVELIAFTTTIVNNTQTKLPVEADGITVDGRRVSLLPVSSSRKGQKEQLKDRTNIIESSNLYCFTSGFLSSENFLSRSDPLPLFVVDPGRSLTVSGVIQDPRHYSLLCTVDGCFPKGIVRYAIRVGGHEYVFIWPGRSIANCGK